MRPFLKAESLSLTKPLACFVMTVQVGSLYLWCRSSIAADVVPTQKNSAQHSKMDKEKTNKEITLIETTLQSQADAWNAGDLDKFMTAYLNSPEITFVSADGEMKGYEALEARYRKKYGTSRDTMGKLSFSDLQIKLLEKQHALCIGHWLVERPDHSKLQGMFSLVLDKVDGAWKIIHDHTSLFPAAASNESKS